LRECAPCSPDCVPAPAIDRCAEAYANAWLESSSTGRNIVNVLKKRGNALNLFRPRLAPQKLDSRTEPAPRLMARAILGRGSSPAASVLPGERRTGHLETKIWPHLRSARTVIYSPNVLTCDSNEATNLSVCSLVTNALFALPFWGTTNAPSVVPSYPPDFGNGASCCRARRSGTQPSGIR
jgi:hypothetical protein